MVRQKFSNLCNQKLFTWRITQHNSVIQSIIQKYNLKNIIEIKISNEIEKSLSIMKIGILK